jgi:hypothetical protein
MRAVMSIGYGIYYRSAGQLIVLAQALLFVRYVKQARGQNGA